MRPLAAAEGNHFLRASGLLQVATLRHVTKAQLHASPRCLSQMPRRCLGRGFSQPRLAFPQHRDHLIHVRLLSLLSIQIEQYQCDWVGLAARKATIGPRVPRSLQERFTLRWCGRP